jgi:hypothetical protein
VATVGLALLLVGAVLAGAVAVASASSATQSITVTPHARLTAAKHVTVSGSGFHHKAKGAVLECNLAPGEPAVTTSIHGRTRSVPIGCTQPRPVATTAKGLLDPVTLSVVTGTLGTWESGLDTSGLPAAGDSAAFPCPPSAAQQHAGVTCAFEFLDTKGELATHSVTFKSPGSTTTTTTTTTSSTTTTTTILGCDPAPQTATGVNTSKGTTPTMTVNPGTCLSGGSVVSLTGIGFQQTIGAALECNSDPQQPTVALEGNTTPVGCTNPLANPPGIVSIPKTGVLGPVSFTVSEGTVGPPCAPSCQPTDSAGGDPTTDAAAYPCPPTPAQTAVGDICVIIFGDLAGDSVAVPISFRN